MKFVRNIALAVVGAALAVTFVAVGFAACTLPPVTRALAGAFATEDVSPFDRAQLVEVADAARDFSFGSHDERALLQAIYEANADLAHALEQRGEQVPAGFPDLDAVADPATADLVQLRAAFAGASELYCFSPAAVAHLDDCHALIATFLPALVCCAVVAAAGLAAVDKVLGRRPLGTVLVVAGAVVLVAFACLGAWALVDFNGLFTSFHQLFFSQGNWQFPYNSLLICSLPTEFWMGMGAIWLLTTFACAVASVLVGRLRLRA